MSEEATPSANSLQRIALDKPIGTSLVLLAIAFFFRWIDTWVLRLDERIGEIILCKVLGFAMVILFVRIAGRRLRDIGPNFPLGEPTCFKRSCLAYGIFRG